MCRITIVTTFIIGIFLSFKYFWEIIALKVHTYGILVSLLFRSYLVQAYQVRPKKERNKYALSMNFEGQYFLKMTINHKK